MLARHHQDDMPFLGTASSRSLKLHICDLGNPGALGVDLNFYISKLGTLVSVGFSISIPYLDVHGYLVTRL